MIRAELEEMLPAGATVFGVESGAKFVVRLNRKQMDRAGALSEAFKRFGVQALVVVADAHEIDVYRINEKLAGAR